MPALGRWCSLLPSPSWAGPKGLSHSDLSWVDTPPHLRLALLLKHSLRGVYCQLAGCLQLE